MTTVSTVTVGGGSAVLTITGNNFVAAHASMFASMAMQMASMANSFYTAPGGNTLFVVPNDMGLADVTGSSGTTNVIAGDGSTLSYHGSASGMVLAGAGNDSVIASAGNDTIALGAGYNNIQLGTGSSVVDSDGTDYIVAGSGVDTINVTGNSTSVYGGYGSSGYTGTSLLVNDGAGSGTFIFAAAKGTLVYGSNRGTTTIVAYGDATDYGGTVADHLYAGNGAWIRLTGTTSGNILVANDGRWANGNFVDLDGGLATGDNQFWAGSGNSTLIGGTGADTLVAGSGQVTISGGTGKGNDFLFFKANGNPGASAVITDFGNAAGNLLFLMGYGQSGINQALSSAHQVNSNTVFNLSDGTTVTLDNFSRSNLTASSFVATNS